MSELRSYMNSQVATGRLIQEGGLYRRPGMGGTAKSGPSGSAGYQGPAELESFSAVVSALGFPGSEGLAGITPFVEVLHGRLAMVGIMASITRELNTDMGTLEQLGVRDLPSMGACMGDLGREDLRTRGSGAAGSSRPSGHLPRV